MFKVIRILLSVLISLAILIPQATLYNHPLQAQEIISFPASSPGEYRLNDSIANAASGNSKHAKITISKAPKIGETAELLFTFGIDQKTTSEDFPHFDHAKAWVEFTWANPHGSYLEAKYAVKVPVEEVLVDGDLSWEGTVYQKDDIQLRGTIILPREGIWEITGYFTGENKDPTAHLGQQEEPVTDSLRIVVGKDMGAAWGSREIYNSPLSLDNKLNPCTLINC